MHIYVLMGIIRQLDRDVLNYYLKCLFMNIAEYTRKYKYHLLALLTAMISVSIYFSQESEPVPDVTEKKPFIVEEDFSDIKAIIPHEISHIIGARDGEFNKRTVFTASGDTFNLFWDAELLPNMKFEVRELHSGGRLFCVFEKCSVII